MSKHSDDETWGVGALYKNLDWVIAPAGAHPQKCGVGLRHWENQRRLSSCTWKFGILKYHKITCTHFPNVVAKRHICGGVDPRGYDPQIRTWLRSLYNGSTPKVSSSYTYSFRSYCVDKQTHKQTLLKTSNVLRYATTLGKYFKTQSYNMMHNVLKTAETQPA